MILHKLKFRRWPAHVRTKACAALAIGLGLSILAAPARSNEVGLATYTEINGAPQGNSYAEYDSTSFGGEGLCVPTAGNGLCYGLGDPSASITTAPNSPLSGYQGYQIYLTAAVGSFGVVSGNLATGTTKINLQSGEGENQSIESTVAGGVTLQDGVTFLFSGGGTKDIGIQFSVSGAVDSPGSESYTQTVLMDLGNAQLQWGASIGGGPPASVLESGTENWVSYTAPVLTPTALTFNGVLAVTSGQDLQFLLKQAINCNLGATCDFEDPGQITLTLPPGVTYTSDSGVFLTQPPSETPEPGAVGLTGVGLAALGLAGSRRRRAKEQEGKAESCADE